MAKGDIKKMRTAEQEARAFLSTVPDEQLQCMGQRHPWPVLDLKKKTLPKGISAVPVRDGGWQMRETCPVCGKVRWYTTTPDGDFDVNVQYRYDDPDGWVVRPAVIEASRRDYKAELFRRARERFGAALFGAA